MIPRMIFFDYGQTLVLEDSIDWAGGFSDMLALCENHCGVTAEALEQFWLRFIDDIGHRQGGLSRFDVEVTCQQIFHYMFNYFSLKPMGPQSELELAFWNGAAPGRPAVGIRELLSELRQRGIRTGVISNILYSTQALTRRIEQYIPDHNFEFFLASSDCVFRKPHPRIFELALRLADLSPDQVWHCGDHPVCDVQGASACGITPVWYSGATQFEPPAQEHIAVDSWPAFLERIDRGR